MGDEEMNQSASYVYDAWYRVTNAQHMREGEEEMMTYGMDELDRITSVSSSLDASSAAHVGEISYDDARPHLVTQAGQMEVDFDATGRLTKRGATTFEWDYMDRMVRAERFGSAQTHVYGAQKSRVAIVGDDSLSLYGFNDFEIRDGVSHAYVKLFDERLAKSVSTELMTAIYVDGDEDGEITAHDGFLMGGQETDGPLGMAHTLGAAAARMLAEAGEEKVFLHTNNIRSIVSATNESGEVIGRRLFSPTGVVLHEQGHVDVYGFTGQEHNAFTGLVQFQMRDFDTLIGRWTSFDPLFAKLSAAQMGSLGEATTGYAYLSNNFGNDVDPTGLVDDQPTGGSTPGGGRDRSSTVNLASSGTSSLGAPSATDIPDGISQDADADMLDLIEDELDDDNNNYGTFFSDSDSLAKETSNPVKKMGGDEYDAVLDRYAAESSDTAKGMNDNTELPRVPDTRQRQHSQVPSGGSETAQTFNKLHDRAKLDRNIKFTIGGIVGASLVLAVALVVADGEDTASSPFDNYSWK